MEEATAARRTLMERRQQQGRPMETIQNLQPSHAQGRH
jgi:hypothetical protein